MFSSSVAAALAAAPCTVWAGPGFGFGWWWILIPIFWIAVFVLIFGFAGRRWRRAAAMRGGFGGYGGPGWGPHASATRSAEQTLAQRYANGDIDEVEYRARLEVLRANRSDGV
ncbi:SHOCT domain-containing protein [Leifsonia aquatica]|uniref:SHOCT domain-containing protein n=1 Tax=Leifsonia aquatica TaxID=144185 RepID=UPI000469673C|nr:SHOCT domain-containing protein [Leifsonia aquatica]